MLVRNIWPVLHGLNCATEIKISKIDKFHLYFYKIQHYYLTLRPKIWLIAADSLSVHSATILGLISFMYSMKAFRGFLICTDRLSSRSRSRADRRPLTEELREPAGACPPGALPAFGPSVVNSVCEWGEKVLLPGGEDRRLPGPEHLDIGLLQKSAIFEMTIECIFDWCDWFWVLS